VAFYKIDKIDTVEQSAFVDFTTQTWWKEPAVTDKKDGEYDVGTFEFKHCIEPGEAIELEKLIEDGNSNVRQARNHALTSPLADFAFSARLVAFCLGLALSWVWIV
jgi:hypothetical protein